MFDTQKPAISPELSFGLNFSSDDLWANQLGHMTGHQVRLLRDKRLMITSPLSLIDRIAGGLFFMLYGVSPQMHEWNLVGADISATITESRAGQVSLPSLTLSKDKANPICQIDVKHKKYKVTRRALGSFQQEREYTLYIAPHSKHVLSAEYYTSA